MPDAPASAFGARQYALNVTKGDRQDDLTGGAGCIKQQTDAGADDPRGLRRAASTRS